MAGVFESMTYAEGPAAAPSRPRFSGSAVYQEIFDRRDLSGASGPWEGNRDRVFLPPCRLPAASPASANATKVITDVWQDAKQLHGHHDARMCGLIRVTEQCLLAAVCQNMKKIALLLARATFLSGITACGDASRSLSGGLACGSPPPAGKPPSSDPEFPKCPPAAKQRGGTALKWPGLGRAIRLLRRR